MKKAKGDFFCLFTVFQYPQYDKLFSYNLIVYLSRQLKLKKLHCHFIYLSLNVRKKKIPKIVIVDDKRIEMQRWVEIDKRSLTIRCFLWIFCYFFFTALHFFFLLFFSRSIYQSSLSVGSFVHFLRVESSLFAEGFFRVLWTFRTILCVILVDLFTCTWLYPYVNFYPYFFSFF